MSSLLLELRADYLREAVLESDERTFMDAASGASVFAFSSGDGSQIYVMRTEDPTDVFYFKAEMTIGMGEG